MSEPITERGAITRSVLLAAAYRQFTRRGFHGASMRSIAEDAGVAVSGIYNHFASKEEIFKAVVLAYHPLGLALPLLAASEHDDFASVVRDAATLLAATWETQPGFLNLMLIDLVECQGRHLPELLQARLPEVLSLAARLAARDDVRPLPPILLVRTLLAALFGYLITGELLKPAANTAPGQLGDALAASGSLDDFLDIYLHGVLAAKEKTP